MQINHFFGKISTRGNVYDSIVFRGRDENLNKITWDQIIQVYKEALGKKTPESKSLYVGVLTDAEIRELAAARAAANAKNPPSK